MVKNIFNTGENFTANSVFQGEVKKYFIAVYSDSKGNYPNVSCQGEHTTQGTSSPWVNKRGNYRICL